jgi:hypothetical protein
MLRSRRSCREELVGVRMPAPIAWRAGQADADEPEEEALLADSVGTALLGAARETLGAMAVARRAVGGGGAATLALVDGVVCGVVAPLGQLLMVLRYTIPRGRIVEIEGIADPERLRQFEIRLLDD